VHAVPKHDGRLVQRVGLGLEVERPGVAPRAAGCVDNVLSFHRKRLLPLGEDFLGGCPCRRQTFPPWEGPVWFCWFLLVFVGLGMYTYLRACARACA